MNIRIKPEKSRYIIYAAIIALFSTVGMNISLMNTNADKILKRLEYNSNLTKLIAIFRASISGKGDMKLFYQMAVAVIFLMFLIVFSYQFTIREILSSTVFSIIFGVCMWIGTVFSHKESWNYFLRNKYVMILDVWYILAYAFFMFGILLCIGKVAKYAGNREAQNVAVKTKHSKINSARKVFVMSMVVLFICWLPYYICLWPGSLHGDFPMQVLQLFHYPTYLQRQLTSDGVNILYSNDHPFIHTQLVGLFIKFGMRIGNLELGYGMYTFLQMIVYIVGISLLLATLYHFHVKYVLVKAGLAMYALIPVFPAYAVLVGGDAFFAMFFIYFMVEMIWIFGTRGSVLDNWKFDIAVIVTLFLLAAAKNQGLYIVAVFFFICLLCMKKYRIKVIITMLVPILFFQFVYTGMIFTACRVNTVGKQEALSFCFQQTARYVKYHGDEVTEEEKQAIDKILKYNILAKKYDPDLSDKVKRTFKKESTSEDLSNYFKVWLAMGLKHPGEYIQAFLANTYSYYCPAFTNKTGLYFKFDTMKGYVAQRKWARETIPEKFVEETSGKVPEKIKPLREKIILLVAGTYKIPVFNWFYNPGVITWMLLLAFFAFWTRKEYFNILTFLPVLLVVGVCLLSPKNNNLRYIYPACCLVPGMLIAAFGGFKKSDLPQA